MTTLLTRMFRDPKHCVQCQVGQGRNCGCRKPRARRPLSITAWWWLILVALSCFWAGVGVAWRAWA